VGMTLGWDLRIRHTDGAVGTVCSGIKDQCCSGLRVCSVHFHWNEENGPMYQRIHQVAV
jgi:hypothetical protein